MIPKTSDVEHVNLQELIRTGSDTTAARLISIGSRRLTVSERRYAAHDKEGLAVFVNLTRHTSLIHMFDHIVYQSDNITALSNFRGMSRETMRGKRWRRWLMSLSDLLYISTPGQLRPRIIFQHIKGAENSLTDYFSRFISFDLGMSDASVQTDNDIENLFAQTLDTVAITDVMSEPVPLVSQLDIQRALLSWEGEASHGDYIKGVPLIQIWELLRSGDDTSASAKLRQIAQRRFTLEESGYLKFNNGSRLVTVVPNTQIQSPNVAGTSVKLRSYIIYHYHEGSSLASHRGGHFTSSSIRRSFYWPGMDVDIKNWINSCHACLLSKFRTPVNYSPRILHGPNDALCIDFAGPFRGNVKYVVVCVDCFSGFVQLYAADNKSSLTVAHAILSWSSTFGAPRCFIHDNELSFKSEISRYICQICQIRDLVSPIYSPRSQGSAERQVRVLKEALAAIETSHSLNNMTCLDMNIAIRAVVWCTNSTIRHNSLTPFEVMLGRMPANFIDLQFQSITESVLNNSEYVEELSKTLEEIRTIWESKCGELKLIECDKETHLEVEFATGDKCCRVCYVSNNRIILDEVVEITSKVGASSYIIQTATGPPELAHGHQLIKICDNPDRTGFRENQ